MLLDSGLLSLYKLKNTAVSGLMPKMQLVKYESAYYGERTVGYNRLYAAKGVNQQVDKLVRIWRNEEVEAGDCTILDSPVTKDSKQYRIDAVQHLLDDDGLKVTDLTLSRLENFYDVISAET